MNSDPINIVFSINDSYIYFGYVAIISLIENIKTKRQYNIYVFVTGLEKKNIHLLESLSGREVKVSCIDISNLISGIHLESSLHLTIETYYRLFIPLILPQCDKVLYLDSDMVILDDVAKIYDTDMEGKPVAAVPDVFSSILQEHSVEIGNLDYKKTFNAGVLLMDTKKFEEEKIREKCLRLLEEDYNRKIRKLIFADQDALNLVLYENTTRLEPRWNCQYQYAWRPEFVDEEYRKEYLESLEHAAILHYAGTKKPWMYPTLPKSDVFWNIAARTPVFTKLMDTIIGTARKEGNAVKIPRRIYAFPYEKIPYKSSVVLYGAGNIGHDFRRQLKLNKYSDVVMWTDSNEDIVNKDSNLKAVKCINDVDYDYVVIAIKNERSANQARDVLLKAGVSQEKIVWDTYHNDWEEQD